MGTSEPMETTGSGPTGRAAARPARGVAVVTCMDTRIDPLQVSGLALGDAHVLRNAGGRVTDDVLRSLAVSTQLLGVRHVMVVHHTGCGMHGAPEQEIRAELEARSGRTFDMQLHAIGDFAAALREDLDRIAACPFLPPGLTADGGLLDLATGEVTWHHSLTPSVL